MHNPKIKTSGRTSLAFVLALALAGCTSLVPTYERPAAPVPEAFGVMPAALPQATPVAEIEWRSFFRDARLQGLIEIALHNNRDLRVAVLAIDQARAQLQVRRADELPTVNAGLNGSRGPQSSGAVTTSLTAGVSVTAYELDFFGRVRSASQAAQAQVLATEEARKTVHISLIASVANAYLSLLADEALLGITRDTVASRAESLRLIQLKFNNAVVSQIELSQAQSLLEAAKVTLAQLARQRALDENALVLLLGQGVPADLPVGLALGDQAFMPPVPAGLPSEILTRRPDILQAEYQLQALNANIGAARAAFFPRITLTGSAGVVGSDLEMLLRSSNAAWSFVPQLLLPIFDAGRNQANLESAQVARDMAVAQYEKAIQIGFREVSDALAGRASFGEQLRAQTAQLGAEQKRTELTELRYQSGTANALDRLDAQRSLFAVQQSTVQVQLQTVQNAVTLFKVLGGGWH